MNFGQNLLYLRKAKGLSQDELGSKLNVSRQTISKWELGETTPEMDKLILLSEYFNVSMDELVKGKKTPDTDTEADDTLEVKSNKQKKSIKDTIFLTLKILSTILGALVLVDIIAMIIYFLTNGFPS